MAIFNAAKFTNKLIMKVKRKRIAKLKLRQNEIYEILKQGIVDLYMKISEQICRPLK